MYVGVYPSPKSGIFAPVFRVANIFDCMILYRGRFLQERGYLLEKRVGVWLACIDAII